MDAVDDALENETPGTEGEEAEDTEGLPEIPLEDEDEGEGDGSDDEEGDEGEEDEGGEEDGEVELGPDGKPLAKAQEKPGKKVPDPINDPIPKGLKQETADRMRTLVKTAKELTVERDAVKNEFATIVNGIQATGATPEQYGEILSWVSLFNSPNIDAKKQAYQLVEDVAARMALQLGIERNIGDSVNNYPDIKEALAKGQITPVHAKELARTRDQNKFATQVRTHTQTQEQQQQAALKERNDARTALNTMEANLKATDPLYERKRAHLVPILKPLFKTMRPSQWPGAFQEAYKNVRLQRNVPANAGAKPKGSGMRPKGAGGGGKSAQPSSALEAMNGALAAMTK